MRRLCAPGQCPDADLRARGDKEANALIVDRLRAARPDDFILSEEAHDDGLRCAARRVWIVDPLDGTREYAEGRADWAVHVALTVDGDPSCSAVALPGIDEVFSTATVRAPGPRSDGPLRIVCACAPAYSDEDTVLSE